jgi:hypothetical protein
MQLSLTIVAVGLYSIHIVGQIELEVRQSQRRQSSSSG